MRGGASRLYSIFFRSVWQMPQASTRIRISPGPISGIGTCSTATTLSPYTRRRAWSSADRGHELRIGSRQEILLACGSPAASSSESNSIPVAYVKGRAGSDAAISCIVSKSPVGASALAIEIQRRSVSPARSDTDADAVKRHVPFARLSARPRRLPSRRPTAPRRCAERAFSAAV